MEMLYIHRWPSWCCREQCCSEWGSVLLRAARQVTTGMQPAVLPCTQPPQSQGQIRTPECLHLAHGLMYHSGTKYAGFCKQNNCRYSLFDEKIKAIQAGDARWLTLHITAVSRLLLSGEWPIFCHLLVEVWVCRDIRWSVGCFWTNRLMVGKDGRRFCSLRFVCFEIRSLFVTGKFWDWVLQGILEWALWEQVGAGRHH